MRTKEFKIEGMSCGHCVTAVNIELEKIGITEKDVRIGSAVVNFDESKHSDKQIIESIKEAGFEVVQ